MPLAAHLRRRAPAAAALIAALACAAPAAGHSGRHATGGAAEKRLQAFETSVLGARHAAEHARLRRFERSPRWRRAARRVRRTERLPASAASTQPLDEIGRWNERFDIPVFGLSAVMLPTGKVLWFAYPNNPDRPAGPQRVSHAWVWDPGLGTGASSFTRIDPPVDPATGQPVNLFCSGNSFTADGRVVVAGGNLAYPAETGDRYAGLNHLYTFDPFTETWRRQPNMNHGRWYPSQLLMPDGRTFIMGGLDEGGHGDKNQDLELFTPSPDMDGVGSLAFLGPEGVLGDPGAPPVGDYYPHLFWMPSGRGLVAGPWTTDSWWFAPPGDPPVLSWEDIPNFSFSRVWGTAVLVPGGTDGSHEVMQLGGADKPAGDTIARRSAALFDERDSPASWRQLTDTATGALNVARAHHNTVLLPDGSMVTVGGGRGSEAVGANGAPAQWAAEPAQLQTELWDPLTRTWRLGAAQQEYRTYHSTALLLPDGRVVSAGDDYNGRFGGAEADRNFTEDSAEIYEPAYLFDGDAAAPRPQIAAAPASLNWTKSYDLATLPAAGVDRPVTRAVLVAPGAATHAVDMNQRFVPLEVTASSPTSLTVKAPANPDIAPAGYYMLFVLDRTGTPSVARWVRLQGPFPPDVPSDFNDDGFSDLAAGAPGESVGSAAGAGMIHVVYGSASGLTTARTRAFHANSTDVAGVANAGDRFGAAVTAGDFNSDGFDDLAVGAPDDDVGPTPDAGSITVLLGSAAGLTGTGSAIYTQASAGIEEVAESGDRYGSSLAAGDFGGRSAEDLAVGVPGESVGSVPGAGAVGILRGSVSGLSLDDDQLITQGGLGAGDEPGDQFGFALAAADFAGSAHTDLAVGAPSEDTGAAADSGAVMVAFGSPGGITPAGGASFHQNTASVPGTNEGGDQLGYALAAGDMTQGGETDLAVGVPGKAVAGEQDAGRIILLPGAAAGLGTTDNRARDESTAGVPGVAEAGDRFGAALAAADFGRSANADLAVGTPGQSLGANTGAGAVTVLYGAAGPLSVTGNQAWSQASRAILDDPESGDGFGATLGSGQFGRSAQSELVVGVPAEDVGVRTDAGAAHVLFGGAALSPSGNQWFSQDRSGIPDAAEGDDRFGAGLDG